jgi:hypothetical protein
MSRSLGPLAVVLLAYACVVAPAGAQQVGFVEIQGIPNGPAQLHVDGELWPEQLSDMPLLLELPEGTYTLRVSREGFESVAQDVQVIADDVEILQFEVVRSSVEVRLVHLLPAELNFQVEAPEQLLQSELRGMTPATIQVLVGDRIFVLGSRRFCFSLVADSSAYIRIREGTLDELRGATECAPNPPVPRGFIIPPDNVRLQGTDVTVHVFVDESGRVVPDSTRLEPPTPDLDFNRRLIREAGDWVFRPATALGRPVAAWFQYRMGF